MPADPRQLKLEIEHHRRRKSAGLSDLLNVIAQAEELARGLPSEKTCKDQTWKDLRSSGLLEELVVMAILPGKALAQPTVSCRKDHDE